MGHRGQYASHAGSAGSVDGSKLALIGYSFGGYLAPRAAAGEPRIAACIPNTLAVDCGEAARAGLRGLTNPLVIDTAFRLLMRVNPAARWGFQHAQWTLGIQQPHEWPAAYADFTLKGLEKRLTNPMLFLFSEDDIQSSAAATRSIVVGLLDFIFSLECDRFVHLFSRQEGASSHCQMGGTTYARASFSAGWTTSCAASLWLMNPTRRLPTASWKPSPDMAGAQPGAERKNSWQLPTWSSKAACQRGVRSRRDVGRKAHDARQIRPKPAGPAHWSGPSPMATCEATAPL